ncbi:DNA adenine methylase [bacterium]|nr:DNA adenine methylase [bacterium]
MSTQLHSPIQWFGGKQLLAKKLLALIPEHHTYVEPFGGGGSLLLTKDPSPVEVYNDLDGDLVNFFRVLRDPAQFADFYQRAWLSPYSREEYSFCKDHLNDNPDPIERARRFFVLARFSFSGVLGNAFGLGVTSSSRGMAEKASAYKNVLCMLPLISERLSRVEIECYDFRRILKIYDTPETFFYLDPPYVPSTRKGGSYRCEMTEEDHRDLVELLRHVTGKVMLSGYPNELYDTLGWDKQEWEVNCKAAGRTRASGLQGEGHVSERQKRVECVWRNY